MLKSWCFSNKKERAKQLLDGVVSSMKTMNNCWNVVFWHWGEGKKLLTMVFQQQKRKGKTIAGRCCFFNGEM
jgi:hypothetical protein